MKKIFFSVIVFLGSFWVLKAQDFDIYQKDTTSRGDTIWNQFDEYGKKQGFWKKDYENGKTMYIGFFQNDKPIGLLTRFYDNGKKKAEFNFKNENEAYTKVFYRDGVIAAEGKYNNQLKDSTWKYYSYYTHVVTSEEVYVNGKKHGTFRYFYESGKPAQIMEWVNDVEHGKWEKYFEDGKVHMKTTMVEGERHGKFITYFPNGRINTIGFYDINRRHGTWQYFDEKGNKTLELKYEYGKLLNEEELTDYEQAVFKEMDDNVGKIKEPTESIYPQ